MDELLAAVPLIVVAAVLCIGAAYRLGVPSGAVLGASFVAHIVAAFAQIELTQRYYAEGDMLTYWDVGLAGARVLDLDMVQFLPEFFRVLVHLEPTVPIPVAPGAETSATMGAVAALLAWITRGSLPAACVLVALCALAGKWAFFRAVEQGVPVEARGRVFAWVLLLPSCVFWSSALLKEAVVLGALGPLTLGAARFIEQRPGRGWGLVLLVVSGTAIFFVKPYVLVTFGVALAAWYYSAAALRSNRSVVARPGQLALAAGVAAFIVIAVGNVYDIYRLDSIADSAARLQSVGTQNTGGSDYQLGSGAGQAGFAVQLALAPFALMTALLRPFVWESRNALMFFNALETAVIAGLLLRLALIRFRQAGTLKPELLRSPVLLFAGGMVLMLGLGVGLVSTNLGTLSRYRAPLIPFLGVVLAGTVWVPARKRVPAARTSVAREGRPA